jgi:hypothetical protein
MHEGVKMEDVHRLIEKVRSDIQDGKSDEEIFQSLVTFWGKAPETDSQIAELLASIPSAKIARILQRMLEVSKEKKVQKIIKRSLYRLKNRGIAVEEVSRGERRSILQTLKAETPKGYASAIDFLGQRLLLLVIPHMGRRWTVAQGVISDTEGLIDFSGEEMTRKEFMRFFEEVREKTPLPFVEMEPSYVEFLLMQAYQLTLEKRRTPPQDFLLLKSEIENVRKEYEKPLIYSYLQADEIAGDDRILTNSEDLLKNDLFSGWRIGEDEIRPYAEAILEAEESKIILNQAQKEARFQEIYLKALSELFSEERRLFFKRRIEEMAYILLKLGRQEEAKISLAIALDLEKPLNLIQPNPFLFQLVIRSILAFLKETSEKKEPSLIVKP